MYCMYIDIWITLPMYICMHLFLHVCVCFLFTNQCKYNWTIRMVTDKMQMLADTTPFPKWRRMGNFQVSRSRSNEIDAETFANMFCQGQDPPTLQVQLLAGFSQTERRWCPLVMCATCCAAASGWVWLNLLQQGHGWSWVAGSIV